MKMRMLAVLGVLVACHSESAGPSLDEVIRQDVPAVQPRIDALESIAARLSTDAPKSVQISGTPLRIAWNDYAPTANASFLYEDDLRLAAVKASYIDRIFAAGRGGAAGCWYAAKKQDWEPEYKAARPDRKFTGKDARGALSRCNQIDYVLVISPESYEQITGADRTTGTFTGGGSSKGTVRVYQLPSGTYQGGFPYSAVISVASGRGDEVASEVSRELERELKAISNVELL